MELHIKLKDKTRILFNKVKGHVIRTNPKENITNEKVLYIVLDKYIRGSLNGGRYKRIS